MNLNRSRMQQRLFHPRTASATKTNYYSRVVESTLLVVVCRTLMIGDCRMHERELAVDAACCIIYL